MGLITKGKEEAFNELYRRYGQKMYAYFYRMLHRDKTSAEDFTQQLFMKIIEQPGLFDQKRRFSTWIYSVASNLLKNEYRRRDRHPAAVALSIGHQITTDEQIIPAIDRSQWQAFLSTALAKLPAKHRECFLLRHQEGLTTQEISKIQDCPEGTVRSRLFYATRSLSEHLAAVNPHK